MTILIRVENERVVVKHYVPEMIEDRTGWIEINNYQEPEQKEGKIANEYYRDGKIVVEYEDIPEPPKDEKDLRLEKMQQQIDELQEALINTFEGGIE